MPTNLLTATIEGEGGDLKEALNDVSSAAKGAASQLEDVEEHVGNLRDDMAEAAQLSDALKENLNEVAGSAKAASSGISSQERSTQDAAAKSSVFSQVLSGLSQELLEATGSSAILSDQVDQVEEQAEEATADVTKLSGSLSALSASSGTAIPIQNALQQSLDETADEADDAAGSMLAVSGAAELLNLQSSALSINLGPFTVALRNLTTQVPLLVSSLGNLSAALAGVAGVVGTLGLGGLGVAIGGAISEVESLAGEASTMEEKMQAMQAIGEEFVDMLREAVDPLVELQGSADVFISLLEEIATTVRVFSQSIADSFENGPLRNSLAIISDAWMQNIEEIGNAFRGMVDALGPRFANLIARFISALPDFIRWVTKTTERIMDIVGTLDGVLGPFIRQFILVGENIADGLLPVLAVFFSAMSQFAEVLNQAGGEAVTTAAKIVGLLFAVNRLSGILGSAILPLTGVAGSLISVANSADKFSVAFFKATSNFTNFMSEAVSGFGRLVTAFSGFLPMVDESGGALAFLADSLKDAEEEMEEASDSTRTLTGSIRKSISVFDGMVQESALVDRATDRISRSMETVKGVASGATDAIAGYAAAIGSAIHPANLFESATSRLASGIDVLSGGFGGIEESLNSFVAGIELGPPTDLEKSLNNFVSGIELGPPTGLEKSLNNFVSGIELGPPTGLEKKINNFVSSIETGEPTGLRNRITKFASDVEESLNNFVAGIELGPPTGLEKKINSFVSSIETDGIAGQLNKTLGDKISPFDADFEEDIDTISASTFFDDEGKRHITFTGRLKLLKNEAIRKAQGLTDTVQSTLSPTDFTYNPDEAIESISDGTDEIAGEFDRSGSVLANKIQTLDRTVDDALKRDFESINKRFSKVLDPGSLTIEDIDAIDDEAFLSGSPLNIDTEATLRGRVRLRTSRAVRKAKEFGSRLTGLIPTIDGVSSTLDNASGDFLRLSTYTDLAGQGVSVLTGRLGELKASMLSTSIGGHEVGESLSKVRSETRDMVSQTQVADKSLDQLSQGFITAAAKTNPPREAIDDMEDELKEMAASGNLAGSSIDELADELDEATGSAFVAEEVMENLNDQYTQTSVRAGIAARANTVLSGSFTTLTGAISTTLLPALGALFAAFAALVLVGGAITAVLASIGKSGKSVKEIVSSVKEAFFTFADTVLPFFVQSGEFVIELVRSITAVFGELVDAGEEIAVALGLMEESTDSGASGFEKFINTVDSIVQTVNPVIKAIGDFIRLIAGEMIIGIRNAADAFIDFINIMHAPTIIQTIINGARGIANSIGSIEGVMKGVVNIVGTFVSGLAKLTTILVVVGTIAGIAALGVSGFAMALWSAIAGLVTISAPISGTAAAIGALIVAVVVILEKLGILDAILAVIGGTVSVVMDIIMGLVDIIVSLSQKIFNFLKIGEIISKVVSIWGALKNGIMAVVNAFNFAIGVIGDAIGIFMKMYTTIVKLVVEKAIGALVSGVQTAIAFVRGLRNRFIEFLETIPFIKQVVSLFKDGFNEVMNIVDSFVNVILNLPKHIKKGFQAVVKFIEDSINRFIDLVNGLIDLYNKMPGVDDIDKMGEVELGKTGKEANKAVKEAQKAADEEATPSNPEVEEENARGGIFNMSDFLGKDSSKPDVPGSQPRVEYNQGDTVNNFQQDISANPEDKAQISRIAKDAMKEANSFARRQQGGQ